VFGAGNCDCPTAEEDPRIGCLANAGGGEPVVEIPKKRSKFVYRGRARVAAVTLASLDPGDALARILRLSVWIVKHFCHRKEFRRKARPNLV
jgi:hypothetical protein